ncbi:MAG: CorA family divalent cation transporter, partial [Alphaproteobacteria bacterium]|nr:CorA family divalent cation transporter [Alphaproteobacteria bacterium]
MTESLFICAYLLDGTGKAILIDADQAMQLWGDSAEGLWIHINREHPPAQHWLLEQSGLDPLITQSILAKETRPRFDSVPGGVQVNLRGINLNEGAQPEDMVSIRCYCDGKRLITARLPRLRAIDDVRASLSEGRGPKTLGQVLTAIADRLTFRIGDLVLKMDEQVDDMEEMENPDE